MHRPRHPSHRCRRPPAAAGLHRQPHARDDGRLRRNRHQPVARRHAGQAEGRPGPAARGQPRHRPHLRPRLAEPPVRPPGPHQRRARRHLRRPHRHPRLGRRPFRLVLEQGPCARWRNRCHARSPARRQLLRARRENRRPPRHRARRRRRIHRRKTHLPPPGRFRGRFPPLAAARCRIRPHRPVRRRHGRPHRGRRLCDPRQAPTRRPPDAAPVHQHRRSGHRRRPRCPAGAAEGALWQRAAAPHGRQAVCRRCPRRPYRLAAAALPGQARLPRQADDDRRAPPRPPARGRGGADPHPHPRHRRRRHPPGAGQR